MMMKRLFLILFPILLILSLFLLQINNQLHAIRKLPTPGWSRALDAQKPLATTVTPYISPERQAFDIFTSKENTVTRSKLDAQLNVVDQRTFNVKGPVQAIVWGKQDAFVFEKEDQLFYYKNKKTSLVAPKWEHVGSAPKKVVYSLSNKLFEYIPGTPTSNEIAGFAAPVVTIGLTANGQSMVVATKPKTSNRYTFFLLRDQGETGYHVLKLGYITTKTEYALISSQITETANHYFIVMAFKDLLGKVTLESTTLPLNPLSQEAIGQPKAHPLTIKASGQTLSFINNLHLSNKGGTPSLLFVSGTSESLEDTLYQAEPNKDGAWVAEKRSDSYHLKSHPLWLSSSHDLILWLRPKSASLSQVKFTSHAPKLAEKSLALKGEDLLLAVKKTNDDIDKMGRFFILLIIYGLPALILYTILRNWVGKPENRERILLSSLVVLFLSETQFLYFILKGSTHLPAYLHFPFNSLVFGIGMGLVCTLFSWLVASEKGTAKGRVTYCLTLYLLSLTFLIGPYF